MCHNSITGGHMNFILGSQHEDDPPTSESQNGCNSNDEICSLWFNISKTETSINFHIGVYVQQELWVTWPNFWKSRSKVKVTRAHNVYR